MWEVYHVMVEVGRWRYLLVGLWVVIFGKLATLEKSR